MPNTITAMPDPSDTAGTTTVPTPSTGHDTWAQITSRLDLVPSWLWAALLITLFAFTVIALPAARHQIRKAGQRTAGKHTPKDRQDRRMLIAALIPAILFWLAVLVGSGRGLIAFAQTDLNWHGGWEFLVPVTLDGVAVAFGALAFRSVHKQRNPDRAQRVVWIATLTSAGLNFAHEVNGSALGAGYLAVLSLFAMLIFHELLAQFEEGTAYIKRENPKFGLRWFTWPTNTTAAWFAWQNHPEKRPAEATVAAAVTHLRTVRAKKTAERAAKVDDPRWTERINPWARSAQLGAALTEHRSEIAAERAQRARLEKTVEQRITDAIAAGTAAAERRAEQAEAAAEQARTEAAERVARLEAEHAAQVSRIREKNTAAPAAAPARTSGNTAPTGTGTEPRLSNDEAVALMLRTHPEPGYEWGTREVARLTGAGMGRVPKLIASVREHHERNAGTGEQNASDDDSQENAS